MCIASDCLWTSRYVFSYPYILWIPLFSFLSLGIAPETISGFTYLHMNRTIWSYKWVNGRGKKEREIWLTLICIAILTHSTSPQRSGNAPEEEILSSISFNMIYGLLFMVPALVMLFDQVTINLLRVNSIICIVRIEEFSLSNIWYIPIYLK